MKQAEESLPLESGILKGLATYGSRLAVFFFIVALSMIPFAWLWLKEDGFLTGYIRDLLSLFYRAIPGVLLFVVIIRFFIRKLEPALRFSQHPLVVSLARIVVIAFPFVAGFSKVSAKSREITTRRT